VVYKFRYELILVYFDVNQSLQPFPMDRRMKQSKAQLEFAFESCYRHAMETTALHKSKTTFVPVTTMEEVPVLSGSERAEILLSLRTAEAEIAAGKFVPHDAEAFVSDMMKLRAAKLSKS
jgi:hypothetical protein